MCSANSLACGCHSDAKLRQASIRLQCECADIYPDLANVLAWKMVLSGPGMATPTMGEAAAEQTVLMEGKEAGWGLLKMPILGWEDKQKGALGEGWCKRPSKAKAEERASWCS